MNLKNIALATRKNFNNTLKKELKKNLKKKNKTNGMTCSGVLQGNQKLKRTTNIKQQQLSNRES